MKGIKLINNFPLATHKDFHRETCCIWPRWFTRGHSYTDNCNTRSLVQTSLSNHAFSTFNAIIPGLYPASERSSVTSFKEQDKLAIFFTQICSHLSAFGFRDTYTIPPDLYQGDTPAAHWIFLSQTLRKVWNQKKSSLPHYKQIGWVFHRNEYSN